MITVKIYNRKIYFDAHRHVKYKHYFYCMLYYANRLSLYLTKVNFNIFKV